MKRGVAYVLVVAGSICAGGIAVADPPKVSAPTTVPDARPIFARRPTPTSLTRLEAEFAKARGKLGIRHDPKAFFAKPPSPTPAAPLMPPPGWTPPSPPPSPTPAPPETSFTLDLSHPFGPTVAFELGNVSTHGEGTTNSFLNVAPSATATSSFTIHSLQAAGNYLADCQCASWGGQDFKVELFNIYNLEQTMTFSPPADQHLFFTYHNDGTHSYSAKISSPNNGSWTVWSCAVHPL